MCEDNRVSWSADSVTVEIMGPAGGLLRLALGHDEHGPVIRFFSGGPASIYDEDHIWDLSPEQLKSLELGLSLIIDRLNDKVVLR